MRVLVTGSREWKHPAGVYKALDDAREAMHDTPLDPNEPFIVRHGDCPRGADLMAKHWAQRAIAEGLNVREEAYPADWETYGKSAGFKRNAEMVEEGVVDLCLSFFAGPSRGTTHCSTLAAKAGIPVIKYTEGA